MSTRTKAGPRGSDAGRHAHRQMRTMPILAVTYKSVHGGMQINHLGRVTKALYKCFCICRQCMVSCLLHLCVGAFMCSGLFTSLAICVCVSVCVNLSVCLSQLIIRAERPSGTKSHRRALGP